MLMAFLHSKEGHNMTTKIMIHNIYIYKKDSVEKALVHVVLTLRVERGEREREYVI